VVLLVSIAIPLYANAMRQTHENTLVLEVKHLYDAMMQYHADMGFFPAEESFNSTTLAPLSTQGYFTGAEGFTEKLNGDGVLIYLAPDVGGTDQYFILITQSEADPSIIVAAVHTNIIAGTDGWIDGVFVITAEELASASGDMGGDGEGGDEDGGGGGGGGEAIELEGGPAVLGAG
jgi:hypothetical protein